MKKTRIALLLIIAISFSAIPLGLFGFVVAKPEVLPEYIPVDWQSGLAGKVEMPEISAEPMSSGSIQTSGISSSSAVVGQVVYDWYLSVATNDPWMTCMAIEGNIELWVANDLLFESDPWDTRNDDPTNFAITQEMVDYMVDQFNDVIYPTNTEFFGMSADRDGTDTIFEYLGWDPAYYDWADTDNPQRVMVKVFNIRDDNYYNPAYPYYVVGFFSSTYNSYWNRNIMHIDAWRWWQRIGNEGDMWLDEEPWNRPDLVVTRPHVYESTFAHEYQHLIHRDWQSAPAAFMNEGSSMYAEFLCGYGIEDNYFNSYFATPDNSLTVWGDQGDINILADYGVAALWTIYLNDHYGGAAFIREYVQAGIPGIEGINAALQTFGYNKDFYNVYHDWRLANLIRSDFPGHGRYNYQSIDMSSLDPVRIYEVSDLPVPQSTGFDFGTTTTILGYDTGVSLLGPHGTDYIQFTDWRKPGWLYFNGDDDAYLGWLPTSDGFWSGFGDWQDKNLTAEAYVNPDNAVLTLVTKYDIEPYWDYGFVQVSTDGGASWTSLENAYTTYDHDASVRPKVLAQLPGLTGQSPDWATDDWTTMEFDLSAWADQNIMVNFRYMTDWATTEDGWFINEASVSGTPLSLTYESAEADFMVTVVQVIETRWHTLYIPWEMRLNDLFEGYTLGIAYKSISFILVVSATMEVGITDYSFKADRFKWHWCCH